jgi:hypothetical protein
MTYALLKNYATTGNLTDRVQDRAVWLISPMLDLFFVCGLAPWFFGFAIFLFTDGRLDLQTPSQYIVAVLFATASLLIGESHQFTSIVRYYGKFRTRTKAYKLDRVPFWTIYVGLALLVTALGGLATTWPPWLIAILSMVVMGIVIPAMSLFPVVLMQHFCAQAQAVGLMYCGLGNYKLSQSERTSLTVVSWSLIAAGASTIAKPFGTSINGFGIGLIVLVLIATNALTRHLKPGDRCMAWVLSLLAWGGLLATTFGTGTGVLAIVFPTIPSPISAAIGGILPWLPAFAACATILFAVQILRRGFRDGQWLPKGAAVLWANLALFTLVVPLFPTSIMLPIWMLVPVFFHASQHWAVAWYTQAKEIGPGEIDLGKGAYSLRQFCKMFLPVQALSLTVLFLPLIAAHFSGVHLPPLFGSREDSSALTTLPMSWSMLVFYMHYFSDRLVWRPLT